MTGRFWNMGGAAPTYLRASCSGPGSVQPGEGNEAERSGVWGKVAPAGGAGDAKGPQSSASLPPSLCAGLLRQRGAMATCCRPQSSGSLRPNPSPPPPRSGSGGTMWLYRILCVLYPFCKYSLNVPFGCSRGY